MGGILTIDTLLKRTYLLLIGVADVSVMGKSWIIYCSIASLSIPCQVKSSPCLGLSGWCWGQSLLSAWWNWLGIQSSNVWNMVLVCLMWLTWEEHNAQTFEDIERIVDLLKSLLTRTLFEWFHIWKFTHCTALSDFLNSVSFSHWFVCVPFFAVSLLS